MNILSHFFRHTDAVAFRLSRLATHLVFVGFFLSVTTLLCASPADEGILYAVESSYVFKTHLKNDGIRTLSQDGAVTLTGWVSEASHRALAQDTVEAISGVKTVDNQLTVKAESPSEYSDLWLAIKVNSGLMFHENVDADATRISAKDGIVSLHGVASSLAQKELTGEYAKGVDGVRSVQNEMIVAKGPVEVVQTLTEKIDDASITAQIKWALLSHQSTSAMKTHVHTMEGMVTVSGPARNDAEKYLVTKLITEIKGVTSVVNTMDAKVLVASPMENQ